MTHHYTGASHLGLPPPAPWSLHDGDRVVGWTRDNAVGFLGFADQTEAIHAAWVAYRALSRRLARDHGTRPVPIDSAPLTVQHTNDGTGILAGPRLIATIVRPGDERLAGSDTVGFEIEIPEPADELRVRAMAHLMYRTLRKSGVRWALWRKERPAAARRATVNVRQPVTPAAPPSRRATPAWAWPALVLGSVSLLLLALIVPYQAMLTPMFLMFAKLKLTNTLLGLGILHTAIQFPFSLYILRNSFASVPRELDEAALMDGATSAQVLWRVYMPSAVPAIVTVALFAFIMSWNEFLGAIVMMSHSSRFTLPVILATARTETSLGGTDWGMLQAGITISIIPCVLVYLLLQRYYVSGLMSGAVK